MKTYIKNLSEFRHRLFSSLNLIIPLLFLSLSTLANTVTVNSLSELLPYLDDDSINVTLSPGVYTITAADIAAKKFSNPLFLVSGNGSTYNFDGVIINIETAVLQAFGKADITQIKVVGNHNVLKNLTMVDVGDVHDRPTWRATNVVIDGAYNRIEGFHMTVKGSHPYGYGDMFGKGGSFTIRHFKHCGLLVRGESNHVKNCTMIHHAYGHGIYMQAANNPLIEGCYVQGEVRTTDDILLEKGTGSPADEIDFKTDYGYKVQPGFMISLQEEGIRAYDGGETIIDCVAYKRGTSNVTVLNCTVKNMRGGVTLTHATGKKYVEGCTTLGCERGYAIGSGDIIACRGDVSHGPVFGVDYARDNNIKADITLLPVDSIYNGSGCVAYVAGIKNDITIRGITSGISNDLKIFVAGKLTHKGNIDDDKDLPANNCTLNNLTPYPVHIRPSGENCTGETCGVLTDNGNSNKIKKIN